MHWRAIRQSNGRDRSTSPRSGGQAHATQEAYRDREEALQTRHVGAPIPQRQDDARDDQSSVKPFAANAKTERLQSTVATSSNDHEEHLLQIPIPKSSDGLVTFAYQRALRNRIKNAELVTGGEYDTRKYTPTFIHDCLMLPGTLAAVLEKGSPEDIIHRMTPALLPGFHAYVHTQTHQPCLIQSKDTDYVQGMVIFGQGRRGRRLIHEHYRPGARRVKVQVHIEVAVCDPSSASSSSASSSSSATSADTGSGAKAGVFPSTNNDHCVSEPDRMGAGETTTWRLQRRTIWAHAWLHANVRSTETHFRWETDAGWTLEDYFEGKFEPYQPMVIEHVGGYYEDDDGDRNGFGKEGIEGGNGLKKPRKRSGGGGANGVGLMEYERCEEDWSGW